MHAVTPAPLSRCLQLQLGTNSWNRQRFKIQLCCCTNILGNENKQRKERDMGPCATMLPRRRWAAREQRTRARPQRVARGRRLLGSGSFPGCTRPRGTHSRWCPGRKCCPAVVPWVLPGQGELQHLPDTLPLTAAPRPVSQGHPQPLGRLRGGRAHVAGESGAVPKACRDPTRVCTFVSLSKLKSSDSGKTASPASQRHIPIQALMQFELPVAIAKMILLYTGKTRRIRSWCMKPVAVIVAHEKSQGMAGTECAHCRA